MTDEGCNFSIRAAERDALIDTTGEVSDAILEVMEGNLQDV